VDYRVTKRLVRSLLPSSLLHRFLADSLLVCAASVDPHYRTCYMLKYLGLRLRLC
jgi:hypothetical protein